MVTGVQSNLSAAAGYTGGTISIGTGSTSGTGIPGGGTSSGGIIGTGFGTGSRAAAIPRPSPTISITKPSAGADGINRVASAVANLTDQASALIFRN
jgi:hypothetical protein